MTAQSMSYAELVAALRERRPSERALLVCMDGAGASGKSTIARGLAAAAPDVQVIAQDDFYRPQTARYTGPLSLRPHAGDFDLARLRSEVLEPLRGGRAATYRIYDWGSDTMLPVPVPVTKPIVVVEGVYSASAAQRAFFDIAIWVECPRALRLERGLARDGETARALWEQDWMLGEDRYIEDERPRDRATLVCDGSLENAASVSVLRQKWPPLQRAGR
jgi:uridine kinase